MPESFSLAELFKQAGNNSADTCPTGEVDVEVVSAQAVTSSNGNPMLKVKHRITSGPYAGRTVYDNIVLTVDNPDAVPYFFAKLGALGIKDPALFEQAGSSLVPIAKVLPGARATVVLEARTWNGSTKPSVKEYKQGGGQAPDAVPTQDFAPIAEDEEPF